MSSLNRSIVSKSKKVVLPGIYLKELKPLSSFLTPRLLLIPMFLVSNLAQITEDLKGVLSSKEVQKLPSVKFYSKVLSSGFSSSSISLLQAIAKTLGSEFEVLSVLSPLERINFLKEVYTKLLNDKSLGSINFSGAYSFDDPISLFKYRKGIALQTRSIMISTSIFSSHSIVVGISIKEISLDVILDSSRSLWALLGLDPEEFDFLLHKEAFSCLKSINFTTDLSSASKLDFKNSFLILLYDEFSRFLSIKDKLVFSEDQIVLHGEDNLTVLENSIKFVERFFPGLPNEVYISDNQLEDDILRTSFDQQRAYRLKLDKIYKSVAKGLSKKDLRPGYLKNKQLRDFVN